MRETGRPDQDTGKSTGVAVHETVTYQEGVSPREIADDGPLRRGATLGRYVVLGPVGSGGMGAVHAAYDPELDRKVALKVLHPRHSPSAHQRARLQQRLAREAQALAKLNHPNVLTVFDVGSVGSRLFLATELVDGVTLRTWLDHAPSPKRILARFCLAGEGLWAAHEAGLVHRDFKPANVMTTVEGRVLVLDFGLARPDRPESEGEGPVLALDGLGSASEAPELGDGLTHTGVAMGTPAYMAPEQHHGSAVGPAADQFSFCLALWWALTGESPFVDAGREVGKKRLARGWVVAETPAARRLPAHVRDALLAGLREQPDERFTSMRALLDALMADPWRKRRRAMVAVVAVVGVALAAFGIHQAIDRRRQLCGGAKSKLAGIWDEPRRAGLGQIFAASTKLFAADAWRETERLLDDYSQAWATTHAETCAATQLRGEQSTDLLDRRMACLDQRRRELGALASLLEEGDDKLIEASVDAASRLTPLEVCSDTTALLATLKPPEDDLIREQVDALRERLAEVKAHHDSGDFEGGLKLAIPLVEEAEQLGYWPLSAEGLLILGRIQEGMFDLAEAVATFESAGHAAQAGGHGRVAVEAFTRLVRVTGYQQADYKAGFRWGRLAAAAIERLDQATGLRAELADLLGALHAQQGQYDVALVEHERALALKKETFGPDHIEVATTLARLGNVFYFQHRGEQALGYYREALAIEERAFGSSHPSVATGISRIGSAFMVMGDYQQALVEHERALALRRVVLVSDHVLIGYSLFNVGNALLRLRLYDTALERYREALTIIELRLGAEHRDVASVLSNMANVWLDRGAFAAARDAYLRALTIRRAIYIDTPDSPWIAETLGNLGEVEKVAGNFHAARKVFAEALSLVEGKEGSEHLAGDMHAGLGASLVATGRPAAGFDHLERALAIRRELPRDEARMSEIVFARARAYAAPGWFGHDPARACEEAQRAIESLGNSDGPEQRQSIEAWAAAEACVLGSR